VDIRVGFALSKRSFHHLQALIERKPGRGCVPSQHIALLDSGVKAELERGVPAHLTLSIPPPTDNTGWSCA
jgi:hypothetical protein